MHHIIISIISFDKIVLKKGFIEWKKKWTSIKATIKKKLRPYHQHPLWLCFQSGLASYLFVLSNCIYLCGNERIFCNLWNFPKNQLRDKHVLYAPKINSLMSTTRSCLGWREVNKQGRTFHLLSGGGGQPLKVPTVCLCYSYNSVSNPIGPDAWMYVF